MLLREELGTRVEMYAATFFLVGGGIKNQKKQVELVEELLSSYSALGCNMSVETPFPALPLGIFFSHEKYMSRL
jgi:hypothetical protein